MAWTMKSIVPHCFLISANTASTEAMSSTSQGRMILLLSDSASGLTRRPSASPWKVKASSAPWSASVLAMPQAIE